MLCHILVYLSKILQKMENLHKTKKKKWSHGAMVVYDDFLEKLCQDRVKSRFTKYRETHCFSLISTNVNIWKHDLKIISKILTYGIRMKCLISCFSLIRYVYKNLIKWTWNIIVNAENPGILQYYKSTPLSYFVVG